MPDTRKLPAEHLAAKAARASAGGQPKPTEPGGDPARLELWKHVRDALIALPSFFRSPLRVSGVLATDLFTFNASLGATIEQQVVEQLNLLRQVWDPNGKYALYRFERQPQRFPDVVLRTAAPSLPSVPLMGIELKGWYVLAKEKEPSFRYVTTPAVSTEYDLLAVFPWALADVVSGSPTLFDPFIVGARFAADYRNWHWQTVKNSRKASTLRVSSVTTHYPLKSEPISDRAINDDGGNFGRIARTELMDEFNRELFRQRLSGIPLDAWQRFFKVFTEDDPTEKLDRVVDRLAKEIATAKGLDRDRADEIVAKLRGIAGLISET